MRVVSLVPALTLVAALAAGAAVAEEDVAPPNEAHWRVVLKDQLKAEKACDLHEVITFQEIPLGNTVGLDGRISCIDGREFNFARKGDQPKFSLEACAPAVC